ncbi:MAG: extracellular solute-binding protein [Ruminococcaceae bacterium]|nr:extracellular solute-binding protein [Oscillospiraceae bacterium]
MKKRIIAALLACLLLLSLAACGGGGGSTTLDGSGAGEPLTKDDVITFMVPSSGSSPAREDWKLFEYMAEGSGATLDLMLVPDTEAATKLPLLFAAREELPDLMAFQTRNEANKYAGNGLVALNDLEAYMPTYNAWLSSLSDEQYDIAVKNRVYSDGKIYYTPGTGREGLNRMSAWLYREDIFKKHNLTTPTTFDELYEVCKTLKELYPDSYPLCMRSGFTFINIAGTGFDKWWQHSAYYDYDDEEWRWGAAEETAIEVVEYFKKMVDEKLMPADFSTMNSSTWQELLLTDRGFIFPMVTTWIDTLNTLASSKYPEFRFSAFAPPVSNSGKGVSAVARGDIEQYGVGIPDTGNKDGIANAAKLVDWMYTDEARELLSWGKEGETYEVADGKRKFITDDAGTLPNSLYGFMTYGSFTRIDSEAVMATQTEATAETRDLVQEHTLPYYNPTIYLSFNDEEQAAIDTYLTQCITHTNEMLTKFILGIEPISNFDSFVKTLEELGVNEVVAAYKSAYDRIG